MNELNCKVKHENTVEGMEGMEYSIKSRVVYSDPRTIQCNARLQGGITANPEVITLLSDCFNPVLYILFTARWKF